MGLLLGAQNKQSASGLETTGTVARPSVIGARFVYALERRSRCVIIAGRGYRALSALSFGGYCGLGLSAAVFLDAGCRQ
jgi:hypothetical protein